MASHLLAEATKIFGEEILKPLLEKPETSTEKISNILEKYGEVFEVPVKEIFLNIEKRLKKLETLSTEIAEKFITGLLEFSGMICLDEYILYVMNHGKKPELSLKNIKK